MQRLEVSGAVRPIYGSLGFKGLIRIIGVILYLYVPSSAFSQLPKSLIDVHVDSWLVSRYGRPYSSYGFVQYLLLRPSSHFVHADCCLQRHVTDSLLALTDGRRWGLHFQTREDKLRGPGR